MASDGAPKTFSNLAQRRYELGLPGLRVPGEPRDESGLSSVYRAQEAYAHRKFHPTVLGIACTLQFFAALIGPWVPGKVRGDSLEGFLVPIVPWFALLVLIFVVLAVWHDDVTAAYAGGVFGLFLFPYYFVGTLLSLVSLVLLTKVETVGPRPRARKRRKNP